MSSKTPAEEVDRKYGGTRNELALSTGRKWRYGLSNKDMKFQNQIRVFIRGIAILVTLALLFLLTITRPFVFSIHQLTLDRQADPTKLESYVQLISRDFIPRDWEHPENLEKLSSFIAEEFKQTGASVNFQAFDVRGKEYRNVIASYGSDSDLGTVIIGAHYDACGPFPGADDNASGVAGILELGRLLAGQKLPFKVTLVAYTLEEPPFYASAHMGSAVHAAALKAGAENVHLMIALEMIGYFSDSPESQNFPIAGMNYLYPNSGNFLAVVGPYSFSTATIDLKLAYVSSTTLPVVSINAPKFVMGVDFSDHRNYWANGFDAVMLTDTAFFRNEAYHTAQDTPQRLDYKKMSMVVDGIYAYLLKLG